MSLVFLLSGCRIRQLSLYIIHFDDFLQKTFDTVKVHASVTSPYTLQYVLHLLLQYHCYKKLNWSSYLHNMHLKMSCIVYIKNVLLVCLAGLWKEVALEDDVWMAFGCHPKHATEFTPRAEEGLIRCLQHKKVVALGEIGLDYSGM